VTEHLDAVGRVMHSAARMYRDGARHLQRHWKDEDNGYCIMAAIDEAIVKHVAPYPPQQRIAISLNLYSDASDRLQRHVGAHPLTWNNQPGRTVSEVIAALEGAATLTSHERK
jgi:hypothetical protein